MSDVSESAAPWASLLPPEAIKGWAAVDQDAPRIILTEIQHEARHQRQLAWAKLIAAVLLQLASLAALVGLVRSGQSLHGAAALGAGTATVAAILLTGRSPGRKRR